MPIYNRGVELLQLIDSIVAICRHFPVDICLGEGLRPRGVYPIPLWIMSLSDLRWCHIWSKMLKYSKKNLPKFENALIFLFFKVGSSAFQFFFVSS